jgi:predicted PurR-regulated permease PerM
MQISESQRWFLLITLVISGVLIYLLAPILTPFLVGALLAYLTDPVADRLEARGLGRTQAVVVVFLLLTLTVALAILLLIPQLSDQIQTMVRQAPAVIEVLHTRLIPWIEQNTGVSISRPDMEGLRQLIRDHWQQTGNLAAQLMSGLTRSGLAVVGWVANLVLIPVVTFYLLRDWDLMMANIRQLLPRNMEPKVTLWARECDEVLGAFIKGQLLVMLALGAIYALGLWIVGLDLALLIGMLAGLASIVPYMGSILGIVVAALAAYVQFQDPLVLVWVGLVFGAGQAIEGMVLTPLLVGDRIGLHPVAVIFAIMAGGQLFGFVGVLLALPVAAVIMVLLRHLHEGYKRSRLYDSVATDESGKAGEVE